MKRPVSRETAVHGPPLRRTLRAWPLLALLALLAAGSTTAAAEPVATAKIAEWAASSRGGRADYREVSHGRTLDIGTLVVPGKITIVDFSSDYCAPCVGLAMFLIQASKSHPERYAIRRVDINRPGFVGIDYQSPVAKQYEIKGLPFIVVFDSGRRVAEGDGARKWLIDDLKKLEPSPDGAPARPASDGAPTR